MIGWVVDRLKRASDVQPGQRKLLGLVWSHLAVVGITLAFLVAAKFLSDVALTAVQVVVPQAFYIIAGIYGAMIGGNVIEHRSNGKTPPPPEQGLERVPPQSTPPGA